MQSHEIDQVVATFMASTRAEQQQLLQRMMTDADPDAIRRAAAAASAASPAAHQALSAAFPGVSLKQRGKLYLTVLWILAVLAFFGLIGGAAALLTDNDAAAFFTFAGLALGGITGILVPTPSAGGGS